jgi:hypothetical protein
MSNQLVFALKGDNISWRTTPWKRSGKILLEMFHYGIVTGELSTRRELLHKYKGVSNFVEYKAEERE